ncbi:hypothetical protein BaRGS_00002798 [Batillaria attramentaria]|uniref:Uncharacterized protein n=1 Tax=Batillaria attramentaria TaxID=370345 RepID=A0ABD0M3I4_9CAEN
MTEEDLSRQFASEVSVGRAHMQPFLSACPRSSGGQTLTQYVGDRCRLCRCLLPADRVVSDARAGVCRSGLGFACIFAGRTQCWRSNTGWAQALKEKAGVCLTKPSAN